MNILLFTPLLLLLLLLVPSTGSIKINGNSPVDDYGDGRGASCERGNASFCHSEKPKQKPVTSVPGPLPIGGVVAAFMYARRIRSRISK